MLVDMPMKVTERLFLTRAALESLPPKLQGVTLDAPDGVPVMGSPGQGTRADDSGWIRIDAVPDDGDPENYKEHITLRFPPTSVAALLLVPDVE